MVQIANKLHGWSASKINKFWKVKHKDLIVIGNLGNPLSKQFHSRVRMLLEKHQRVFLIPGPSELTDSKYGISEMFGFLYNATNKYPNFSILNNRSVRIDGVEIFGATSWYSDISRPFDESILSYSFDTNGIESVNCISGEDISSLHNRSLRAYRQFVDNHRGQKMTAATYFQLPSSISTLPLTSVYYAQKWHNT